MTTISKDFIEILLEQQKWQEKIDADKWDRKLRKNKTQNF